MKKTIYIQAEKYTWESEFKIALNTFHSKSSENAIVIDIDQVEVDIDVPGFTQEQFTNGHVEQLRKIKEELKADTHMKIQSLDDQIESLLALECK